MAPPVREGEILAGKYRVERILGEGGMGVVVAARHVELDELVALKFLLPHVLAVPEAVGRFLREARAAVRIKSEHVARVSDVGTLDTGAPYMVMEYLEGKDLGQVLASSGPRSIEEAVDYVAQACEAIAEAHAIGIVHRDLKPSNLMLVRSSDGTDCVKLLDFGISKHSTPGSEGAMAMTRTTTMLGSPLYMSPEQMMSARDVDSRTDIWALGTILYELLVGSAPFTAETLPALGVLIATAPTPSMRATRKDIPPALDAIVARCLAKNRQDRYQTVGQLAEALSPFAPPHAQASIRRATRILEASQSASGGRTKPGYAPPVQASTGHGGTAFNWGQTADDGSGKRRAVVIGGLALTAVIAVGLVVLLHSHSEPAHALSSAEPERTTAPAPTAPAPTAAAPEPPKVEAAPAAAPPAETSTTAAPASSSVRATPASRSKAHAAPTPSKPQAAPGAAPTRTKKSAYDDM